MTSMPPVPTGRRRRPAYLMRCRHVGPGGGPLAPPLRSSPSWWPSAPACSGDRSRSHRRARHERSGCVGREPPSAVTYEPRPPPATGAHLRRRAPRRPRPCTDRSPEAAGPVVLRREHARSCLGGRRRPRRRAPAERSISPAPWRRLRPACSTARPTPTARPRWSAASSSCPRRRARGRPTGRGVGARHHGHRRPVRRAPPATSSTTTTAPWDEPCSTRVRRSRHRLPRPRHARRAHVPPQRGWRTPIDSVAAAHDLTDVAPLRREWFVVGHSEGGLAALATGAAASGRSPTSTTAAVVAAPRHRWAPCAPHVRHRGRGYAVPLLEAVAGIAPGSRSKRRARALGLPRAAKRW